MTTSHELIRLQHETAAVTFALLASLEPEKRQKVLKILELSDSFGGTPNGIVALVKEMLAFREDELPEVDHG